MPVFVMHSFVTSLKHAVSSPLVIIFVMFLFVKPTNLCNVLLLLLLLLLRLIE
jgi:hypothetical protein